MQIRKAAVEATPSRVEQASKQQRDELGQTCQTLSEIKRKEGCGGGFQKEKKGSAAGRTARADVAEREDTVFGTSQWEPRERSAPFS